LSTTANNTRSWAKVVERGSRTTAECEDMEEGEETDVTTSAEATQCVLKECENQRMEQDPKIVENTQKGGGTKSSRAH
jgi:hypothetical protein